MNNLLVSFSGGESSAYMAQWIKNHNNSDYNLIYTFANTGEENEKTLEFVDRCDKYFGLDIIWLECITNPLFGKGVNFKIVNFETANRDGGPFESMISKHGIPNMDFPHCTRELKKRTMEAYAKSIGWKDYYTAIGIRLDEPHRINKNWKKLKLIYPLISNQFSPMTKQNINSYWRDMSFRLELKGYEDNCKVCWKKSLRKLLTIAKNHPERFEKFKEWENKYENYIPQKRQNNSNIKLPIRFFRDNLSVDDILKMSKQPFEESPDERLIYMEYKQTELFGHTLDIGGGPCGSEACEIN